jgi:hypothetical protein
MLPPINPLSNILFPKPLSPHLLMGQLFHLLSPPCSHPNPPLNPFVNPSMPYSTSLVKFISSHGGIMIRKNELQEEEEMEKTKLNKGQIKGIKGIKGKKKIITLDQNQGLKVPL